MSQFLAVYAKQNETKTRQ